MRGFDKHLHELLVKHPEAALEHAKLFAELPISTQLAIMRRHRPAFGPDGRSREEATLHGGWGIEQPGLLPSGEAQFHAR